MNLSGITAGMGVFLVYIALKSVGVVVATKKSREMAGWLKVVITLVMAVGIGLFTDVTGYSINFWLMLMFMVMAVRDVYYTIVVKSQKSTGIVYFIGWLVPIVAIWTYASIRHMGVWFGGLLVLLLEALESDTYRSRSYISLAMVESVVLAIVAMLNGMGEAAVLGLFYFVVSAYCFVVSGVLQSAVEEKSNEIKSKSKSQGNREARRSQDKTAKKATKKARKKK